MAKNTPPALMETPICHHIPAQGRQLLQRIGSCSAGGGGLGAQRQGPGPAKWERVNLPHRGCEGVGWAACLERSRRSAHTWESHVVPMRAPPVLLRGVQGTGSSVARVWSKFTGAGGWQAEAGAAAWHVFHPETPSSAPVDVRQQEAQERTQPCCCSPPLGAGREP